MVELDTRVNTGDNPGQTKHGKNDGQFHGIYFLLPFCYLKKQSPLKLNCLSGLFCT